MNAMQVYGLVTLNELSLDGQNEFEVLLFTNRLSEMLEFFAARLSDISIDLHALANLAPDLAAQLVTNEVPCDPTAEDLPFIQLAYDEINQDSLTRILAYANIVNANRPLGLPYDFTPFIAQGADGNEWKLYPLSGFEQHLHAVHPDAFALLVGHESLDDLFNSLENFGIDVTVEDYLVLTLAEAITYCKRRNIGLATHW